MLVEIKCEEFKEKVIKFKNGLNCIVGDNNASNSIGKSTTLMIIDYAFGGDTYSKNLEIKNNVGNHKIYFTFSFEGLLFHFYREFDNQDIVFDCDKKEEISIAKYREWLAIQYCITLDELSFRELVGTYSRIYGKDNLNEREPLKDFSSQSAEKSITNLVKLFNKYSSLADYAKSIQLATDKIKAFKNAQKYHFISSINAKTYSGNIIKIKELKEKNTELSDGLENNTLDIDSIQLEKSMEIKKTLAKLRRQRSVIQSSVSRLNDNLSDINPINKFDKEELLSFFPNVNIDKLDNIQQFHSDLKKNLKSEIKEQIKHEELSLSMIDESIKENTGKLLSISNNTSLSKTVIAQLIVIQKEIEELEKQNQEFNNLKNLTEEKKDNQNKYDNEFVTVISFIQDTINAKMDELNNIICENNKKSPLIVFKNKSSYKFETPEDSGTGTNFKNLIVFDLAILQLTQLPFLIHDSILFKQIEDNAIERILELYVHSTKQIFIAFDKIDSYSGNSPNILSNNKVLSLSTNGNQLFGRSWTNK